MAKVNRINTEDYGVCWCAVAVVCLKVLLCACVCSITCTSTVMWCHKQYETKSTSTSTARTSRWTSSCHTSPVNHRSKYTAPHLLVIFPLCKLSCFLLAFIYPDFFLWFQCVKLGCQKSPRSVTFCRPDAISDAQLKESQHRWQFTVFKLVVECIHFWRSEDALSGLPQQTIKSWMLYKQYSNTYGTLGHFIFRWNQSLRLWSETRRKSERLKNGFRPSSD